VQIFQKEITWMPKYINKLKICSRIYNKRRFGGSNKMTSFQFIECFEPYSAFIDSFWACSSCLHFSRGPFNSCIISLVVEYKESLFYSLIFLPDRNSWSLRWVEWSSSWIGLRSTISSYSLFINSASASSVFLIGLWINIIFSLAFWNPSLA